MVNRAKIIVGDSDLEDVRLIESVLKAPGISIISISAEDIEPNAADWHDAAVAILDIDSQRMGGIRAAEILRSNERTRSIPIIFIAGSYSLEREIFKKFDAGTVDCIFRPIDPSVLKSKAKVFGAAYMQRKTLMAQAKSIERNVSELVELKTANKQLQDLTLIDRLTDIPNRRYFERYIDKQWKNCVRIKSYISLMMIDIDNFRAYNDNYGHPLGDRCLKKVAGAVEGMIRRPLDQVFRYGGEEFAVVLPGADKKGGVSVAESIRSNIESLRIVHGFSNMSAYVTISVGVAATVPRIGASSAEFIKAADSAMHDAKMQGKNRVVGVECAGAGV